MKLVGLITSKNDDWVIARSAGRLAESCDAIVAVDDGSTDRTYDILSSVPRVAEIVRNLPGRDYEPQRDFDRMMAIVHRMRPDWVMYVDSDDVVDARFADRKEQMLSQPDVGRWFFREITLWGGVDRYRVDHPEWYGRTRDRTPHLVRYGPELQATPLAWSWKERLVKRLRYTPPARALRWRVPKPAEPLPGRLGAIATDIVWPRDLMDYTNMTFRGYAGSERETDLVRLHYHYADLHHAWQKHMAYALLGAIKQGRPPGDVPEIVRWASSKLSEEGLVLAPVDPAWGAL